MKLSDIIGQPRAIEMLQHAISSRRLHHTLLFMGPLGVGKWTTANAVAAASLCNEQVSGDACGICSSCRRVFSLAHPDVHYIIPFPTGSGVSAEKRLDHEKGLLADWLEARRKNPFVHHDQDPAASISIHWIRHLQKTIALRSHEHGPRFVIIREADKIGSVAANALLKTLEEPPRDAVLILTTSSPASMLPTVLSRCQRVMFRSLGKGEMMEAIEGLRKRIRAHGARNSDQALSELCSQMEEETAVQCANLTGGQPGKWVDLISRKPPPTRDYAFALLEQGVGKDIPGRLEEIESLVGKRRLDSADCIYLLDWLQHVLRDVLAHKSGGSIEHTDMLRSIEKASERLSSEEAIRMLDIVIRRRRLYQSQGSRNVNSPLLLAVTLADLARKGH